MRRIILLFITLCLTACGFTSPHVVETRDIVVPQKYNALEPGLDCASIDVTDTTIHAHS
jgi:hypothetical protein